MRKVPCCLVLQVTRANRIESRERMYVSERTCSPPVKKGSFPPPPVTDITHILASGMQVISPFGDAGPGPKNITIITTYLHVKEATVRLGGRTEGGGFDRCRLILGLISRSQP